MSIYDLRNQVELEQYTIKQAMVVMKAAAEEEDPEGEERSVMMDVVISLLNQAFGGLDEIVNNMTQYGREETWT